MNLTRKMGNLLRRATQSWGSAAMKRRLWNSEFAEGRWNFIDNTPEDVVYRFIEKYSRGGAILDLGCGSGNTGCELPISSYSTYVGVDISDVALAKAAQRSARCHREDRNRYVQGDIESYQPDSFFDVILFRESIYYVPKSRIPAMLARYSDWLTDGGVFIVRWHDAESGQRILTLLNGRFEVAEACAVPQAGPFIGVFGKRERGGRCDLHECPRPVQIADANASI